MDATIKKKKGPDISEQHEIILQDAVKFGHPSPNLLHTDKWLEF